VFANEYNRRGGTWVDDSAVGPQAESALPMNRIAGGNPPAAMQWPVGEPTRELYEQGMPSILDELAAAANWAKNLPPIILRNVSFTGFVAAPVDIHGTNWMFYRTKAFKTVNLELPKSWEEFFAMAPKLPAGLHPDRLRRERAAAGRAFHGVPRRDRRQRNLPGDRCAA
jgi:glucose/mannose transport system substrate-binding protein